MRGVNDDELVPLLEHSRALGAEIRFIEYMDVGGATRWSPDAVVSRQEMLATLEEHFGPIEPILEASSAPADRFRLPDGLVFGIISSTTEPFCASCDRARLTADGMWLMCLYAQAGTDLRRPLRAGATREELMALISAVWSSRADRGAEERLAAEQRDALIPLAASARTRTWRCTRAEGRFQLPATSFQRADLVAGRCCSGRCPTRAARQIDRPPDVNTHSTPADPHRHQIHTGSTDVRVEASIATQRSSGSVQLSDSGCLMPTGG
jgi:hypothetical protein